MSAFYCVYNKHVQGYVSSWRADEHKRQLLFAGFSRKFLTEDAAYMFVDTTVGGNGVAVSNMNHILPNDMYERSHFEIHKFDVVKKTAIR